ncbi:glycosyltransferase family 4 protein [Rossellomorea marisflavi]|uniref:glycosyltransferase family 4 protein n=1 Tax=Rossellomorea marisflavi TaxID=189381 RepID=UPI003D2EC0C5
MRILINSGRVVPFFNTRNRLLKSLLAGDNKITLSGFQTGYEKELNDLDVEFVKASVSRAGINPLKDIKLIFEYYKIIKKNKIELIHSYTIKPNIYGTIAAKIAGVKEIYPTVNGLGYAYTGTDNKTKIIRFFTSILYKIAFSFAKKVFFQNSDDAKEMIERKIISKEKCVVIAGSGIDLEEFNYLPPVNDISFIMVTRLLKSKGVNEYLQAARIVKSQYPKVSIRLVGPLDPNPDGIKEEELRKYIDEGLVEYLGVRKDIHTLLGASSVFVLPSYYREGVPHSILEAMATGRAILTTDSPGCRETVKEGVNGYLLEAKNPNVLAEKMLWMIENPERVKTMGLESLRYAEEKFEVNKVNSSILSTMGIQDKERDIEGGNQIRLSN